MAVRTTRQSLTDLKESITNTEDIVIIPAEIFTSLVESNAEQHDKLIQITGNLDKMISEFTQQMKNAAQENAALQIKLCETLERVAGNVAVPPMLPDDDGFQQSLLTKLDVLTQTIASNGSMSGQSKDDQLKKMAERKKLLLTKTIRSEKLSEYYKELLQQENPFVPHMYRSKIHRTTPEFEKEYHKQIAIDTVNSQIKLLDARVNNWKQELLKTETELNEILATLQESRQKEFTDNAAKDADNTKRERAKSFDKLKQSYEEEMNAADADTDLFLLAYAEKDNQNNSSGSKNSRGHFPRRRGRGRGWQQN